MKKIGTWLEQYEWVQRYYKKFQRINEGMPITREDSHRFNLQDEVYAFFIHYYHFMNWIDNDKTLKFPKNKAQNFVNQNDCPRLCKDVYNGIKHLTKDQEDSKPRFENEGQVSCKIKEGELKSVRIKF